jgi:hypothetical protein
MQGLQMQNKVTILAFPEHAPTPAPTSPHPGSKPSDITPNSLGDFERMSYPKRILVYLALLPVSFIGFAVAWALLAPSCLYYCWDDAPPFLISWCPPFIHPWADSLDGKLHDFYRVPESLVYSVWLLFIAGVLFVPAFIIWRSVMRRKSLPNLQSSGSALWIS